MTIFVAILLYRAATSSSGVDSVRGNLLDVSLLFLYITFIVWVSYSESPPELAVDLTNTTNTPPTFDDIPQTEEKKNFILNSFQSLRGSSTEEKKDFLLNSFQSLRDSYTTRKTLVTDTFHSLHDFYHSDNTFKGAFFSFLQETTANFPSYLFGNFSLLKLFSLLLSLVSVVGVSVSVTADRLDEDVEVEGMVYDNLLQSLSIFLFTNILLSLSSNLTFSLASARIIEAISAGLIYGL
eukprot:CAMPEP_0201507292 /NCGR_PEP_ID=MMETSP0161_2-20130828/994_1 /ASSEMBLY_ACC=CAM_ASM_000251 /TAXON_ID=180227 /ORGANISM="Neoparamoeba aestuarina, Strain SoJaBio B1-5/56/2" /LENGTH=237 /DNA_ID=CAMNT_0047901613 /DNA_START=653 /DNA_END=1363 /DNA_ORIENTATION=-